MTGVSESQPTCLTLDFVNNNVSTVCVCVLSPATEAHDDDGLPHTLEHLIFLGSEDYPYKVSQSVLHCLYLSPGTLYEQLIVSLSRCSFTKHMLSDILSHSDSVTVSLFFSSVRLSLSLHLLSIDLFLPVL